MGDFASLMHSEREDISEQLMNMIDQAAAASQDGQVDEAIRLYNLAIHLNPSFALAHYGLGAELANQGDIERAEQCLARAVLLDADLLVARYQLGMLLFSQQKIEIAALIWQPLLLDERQDDPDFPYTHLVKAHLALAEGLPQSALAHFEKGLDCAHDFQGLRDEIIGMMHAIGGQAHDGGSTFDVRWMPDTEHIVH